VLKHGMFTKATPNPIAKWWECPRESAGKCVQITPPATSTPNACWDHGTPAAALLSGVDTTSVYDGLTHASLGIFVTYYPKDTDCNTTVYDRWATVHALEKVPEAGYRIAVTEVACYNKLVDYDAIATAADRTFETNTLVVTAAGNEKDSTFVASPGVARRVICVGGYNPQSSLAALVGSHGSTPDQRTKPEIIAPTGAMTAAS